ncbi:MAG: hypothetical protein AAF908_12540 [Pseudomonadota bacterium]
MIVVLIFLGFGFIGWQRATRRGGKTADKVQYALAHAIPAALASMLLIIFAQRMGWIG